MAKSRRIDGSQDWLDDEFGEELVWNDLKPDQKVIVYHIRTEFGRSIAEFVFATVVQNEHLRNCHMLTFSYIEYLSKGVDQIHHRGRYRENVRWKRQPSTKVWLWNHELADYRDERRIKLANINKPKHLPDEFRAGAASRKAYAANRDQIAIARRLQGTAFETLGLSPSVSPEDFKRKQREIFMTWHPDRKLVFMEGGGTAEEFDKTAKRYSDALADVREYISRREQTQAVIDDAMKGNTP